MTWLIITWIEELLCFHYCTVTPISIEGVGPLPQSGPSFFHSPEKTNQTLALERSFHLFCILIGYIVDVEMRDIQLVAICNLPRYTLLNPTLWPWNDAHLPCCDKLKTDHDIWSSATFVSFCPSSSFHTSTINCEDCGKDGVFHQYAHEASSPRICDTSGYWTPEEAVGQSNITLCVCVCTYV